MIASTLSQKKLEIDMCQTVRVIVEKSVKTKTLAPDRFFYDICVGFRDELPLKSFNDKTESSPAFDHI